MRENKTIQISMIKKRQEFQNLFKIHPEVVERITKDMRSRGFDPSFPVFLCEVPEVENFLLDGHMRLESANRAGIKEIPYELKSFPSLDDALDYAIHVQRDRRNITDAELFQQILLVDKRKKRGSKVPSTGKSAARTATILGTSTRKVEYVREVQKKASPIQIKEITSGKKTINSVLSEVKGKGRGSQSLDPEYENLAVKIMLLTTEIFPDLEDITDSKSADWEKALVQLMYQNLKKLRMSL